MQLTMPNKSKSDAETKQVSSLSNIPHSNGKRCSSSFGDVDKDLKCNPIVDCNKGKLKKLSILYKL